MNFQQLRYVRETVRRGLNLTEAANALHTSQPGVSKQIKELEGELGVTIFERRGKRFIGLTEPGKAVVAMVERVLHEAENLKRVADEYSAKDSGNLVIGATHTQARYSLPKVVHAFKRSYPKVTLSLQQGNPTQIAQMLIAGAVDIAIATESLANYSELLALPAYQWHHVVIVPTKHPLAKIDRLQLEDIARYPVITYSAEFAGRSNIDAAFAARAIELNVVLEAIDSDVIKTYVELGMGIGIIAAMAFDAKRDTALRALAADHLFKTNTTRIAVRRGTLLRSYTYDFIELFAPALSRKTIERSSAGEGENYEL